MRLVVGTVAGILVSVWIAGCSGGGFSKRSGEQSSGVFRYALSTIPTTLDPAQVQDSDTIGLLSNMYEGLVSYDEHNQIVGQLAESWTLDKSGTIYTFKLRKGVTFHDGAPLTSAQVKASWSRALGSKINSPIATTYLNDILGSKEVATGKANEVSGVTTPDPLTVVVAIDRPRPYFLGKLTYPCAFVVNPSIAPPTGITAPAQAQGTGPFKLSIFKPDQVVELTANTGYYLGRPKLDKVVRPVIRDSATRLNKYRNHELDYLTVEKQDIKGVQADSSLSPDLNFVPRPAIYYLLLNGNQYAPFKDRHVRRAMLMGINRQRIAEKILSGQPPANRWVPPGILNGAEPTGLKYDPAAAKAELALSSFKTGNQLPELQLTIRADSADARFIADALSADLLQNLGMKVQPRALEWGSLLKARNKGELACAFLSWFGDYLDPQNFLSFLLLSNSGVNFDKWTNPSFDALCNAADVESDKAKRSDYYRKAEQIVIEEVPRIPLYFGQDAILISKKVHGIRKNLLGTMPDFTVTVE